MSTAIKKIQKKIQDFCDKHNLVSPPEHRVMDVMSELGEVAKEILKMSNYGRKPFHYKEELKSELGDLLFAIIALANSFNIDLEEALDIVLKKYETRLKKGTIGSENN